METAANRQCDKDFATDVGDFSEAINHNIRRQRPASVMAYAAVASDETKPSQVFTEPNVKANSAGYRENAGKNVFQWLKMPMKTNISANVITQNSAPALTAANTQTWCIAPILLVQRASQLLHYRWK